MSLNPVIVTRLVQVRQAAQAAPHGGKTAVYAAACAELGMSAATLHRQLGKITMKPERKKRSDAGDVSLSRTEAIAISAALMVSHRKTNKRLMSIGQAVDVMRANGEVRAQRTDPATGEITPLSDSAIARALRHYSLHPDQLNRPTPAVELKSLHPNHVWQIDASLCVLYYLNARTQAESGLQVMDRDKFYKNKPANLKRIEADRVWSYEVTCHYSSAIYVQYVMGAESGANLSECFISATQKREGDPFHGVPFILMMDMGSANTSGLFRNLARRLQVKTIAHAPGNARATGQVEKARDLIERGFESGLRLRPVRDLAELNAQAQRWARWFNATKVHSRHGKTRYDAWLTIAAEQLRVAPPIEVCQALLTEAPETRKVSDQLTVSYKGREFDVRNVPGVMVGEKLHITLNPWVPDAAMVVDTDADGNEVLHSVPVVVRNEAGFREDANVIGEDWARPADTQLEANRREVERFAMDASTDAEAEAKRRAKATPFGGRIDPGKVIDQAPERTFMPRRGTDLAPTTTTSSTALPARVLTQFEAAADLRRKGLEMTREMVISLRTWYPDGVPETELNDLQARLTVRTSLRVVAGGAP
ncbi:DDE-type integrase/transposase/recombinase [Simplicispira psychrophila]|uniref:DDE-type integrase/transposase/recombinase n=1 Tax=Simplicispira psychrophila TaxID=80882 RepID=UPI0004875768|nr:DDE-type integrase/transposase/recombinase [Simplicispira psychrophila]